VSRDTIQSMNHNSYTATGSFSNEGKGDAIAGAFDKISELAAGYFNQPTNSFSNDVSFHLPSHKKSNVSIKPAVEDSVLRGTDKRNKIVDTILESNIEHKLNNEKVDNLSTMARMRSLHFERGNNDTVNDVASLHDLQMKREQAMNAIDENPSYFQREKYKRWRKNERHASKNNSEFVTYSSLRTEDTFGRGPNNMGDCGMNLNIGRAMKDILIDTPTSIVTNYFDKFQCGVLDDVMYNSDEVGEDNDFYSYASSSSSVHSTETNRSIEVMSKKHNHKGNIEISPHKLFHNIEQDKNVEMLERKHKTRGRSRGRSKISVYTNSDPHYCQMIVQESSSHIQSKTRNESFNSVKNSNSREEESLDSVINKEEINDDEEINRNEVTTASDDLKKSKPIIYSHNYHGHNGGNRYSVLKLNSLTDRDSEHQNFINVEDKKLTSLYSPGKNVNNFIIHNNSRNLWNIAIDDKARDNIITRSKTEEEIFDKFIPKSCEKDFLIKNFLKDTMSEGILLIWHTNLSSKSNHMSPVSVRAYINISGHSDRDFDSSLTSIFCLKLEPRLSWVIVESSLFHQNSLDSDIAFCQNQCVPSHKHSLNLFDITSVNRAGNGFIDLHLYPSAIPASSLYMTMTNGSIIFFEARDVAEARKLILGIRCLISRLAFSLIVGNPREYANLMQIDSSCISISSKRVTSIDDENEGGLMTEDLLLAQMIKDTTDCLVNKSVEKFYTAEV